MTIFLSLAVWAILAQNAMSNVILTEADAGSTHAVKRGETVELRLKENPSTGYRWSIDIEPSEAATIVASPSAGAAAGVGAPVSRGFKITATRPGVVNLQAKLWRQWEGEGSVTERFSFALQVR